ncbi:MAG: TIGR04283 family arsenosugar biosynthesis glycosyltransferase [Acidobacteriota bacterium]
MLAGAGGARAACYDPTRRVISVIVPVRDEPPEVAERFRVFGSSPDSELIVADHGSRVETSRAFDAVATRRLCDPGSRGARLAKAAAEARGDVLFFLHADSRPPEGALDAIRSSLAAGARAGSFELAYENAGPLLRWIAWWANRRSRWFALPLGDQGIFCRREEYRRSGGFRDMALCDDLDFVRRLRRLTPITIRREKTVTSARRFERAGVLRQMLRNWRVQLGYFAGVSPEVLVRWYEGPEAKTAPISARRKG